MQRRAIRALAWLDTEENDPPIRFAHGGAGDVLAKAVVTLTHGLVYHSDRRTRKRCAKLVTAILDEAGKLASEPDLTERCA
jgi:hypothetical protein